VNEDGYMTFERAARSLRWRSRLPSKPLDAPARLSDLLSRYLDSTRYVTVTVVRLLMHSTIARHRASLFCSRRNIGTSGGGDTVLDVGTGKGIGVDRLDVEDEGNNVKLEPQVSAKITRVLMKAVSTRRNDQG
jgi:hypothetical protein